MKRLESFFATIAGIALFAMMALTFADVIGRKFVGNSLPGAVELTEIFMVLMIYFALPLASIAGEHIVFDLLDRMLPPALLRWQKSLSHGLTALDLPGCRLGGHAPCGALAGLRRHDGHAGDQPVALPLHDRGDAGRHRPGARVADLA